MDADFLFMITKTKESEFMENSKKKIEWKNCPNCGGYIPKHWERHEKCGWKGEDVKTETRKENTDTQAKEQQEDRAEKRGRSQG